MSRLGATLHDCPITGCEVIGLPSSQIMCPQHYTLVPVRLRQVLDRARSARQRVSAAVREAAAAGGTGEVAPELIAELDSADRAMVEAIFSMVEYVNGLFICRQCQGPIAPGFNSSGRGLCEACDRAHFHASGATLDVQTLRTGAED